MAKVPADWPGKYEDRRMETKELSFAARKKAKAGPQGCANEILETPDSEIKGGVIN